MIDADALRVAVLGLVVVVAGFDLGIAFLIRAVREAGGDDTRD